MVSINKYPQEYIDECRSRIALQIAAYRDLLAVARDLDQAGGSRLSSAIDVFEPRFFKNMALVLDNCFRHRSRLSNAFFTEIESKFL
jgi:hypothetical protein